MGEHRIRLRGAWDMRVGLDEGEEQDFRRVDLPIAWPPDVASRFRLHRRFGRPPLDPDRESASLELAGVPGLVAVRINGREVDGPPPGDGRWSVPLEGPLLPRNELVLEVDLGGMARADLPGAWGSIALVIASREA